MRIVTFTAYNSDRKFLVDANRVEAVEECNKEYSSAVDVTAIHTWSGSTFRVKGTLDATRKALWAEGRPRGRGSLGRCE